MKKYALLSVIVLFASLSAFSQTEKYVTGLKIEKAKWEKTFGPLVKVVVTNVFTSIHINEYTPVYYLVTKNVSLDSSKYITWTFETHKQKMDVKEGDTIFVSFKHKLFILNEMTVVRLFSCQRIDDNETL